jgi:hypothetical protein
MEKGELARVPISCIPERDLWSDRSVLGCGAEITHIEGGVVGLVVYPSVYRCSGCFAEGYCNASSLKKTDN